MTQLDILTAQSAANEPERFQSEIITNLGRALLRHNPPPCLLRAPTGSGKTFMLARVLTNVSAERGVLWFWFVPFVNLVAQTLDALAANANDLSPQLLTHGRNQEAAAGQVLISTVQAVARAQSRTKGYNADGDDDTRTLAELVARARAQKLHIGMVVDEAHIALDKATEFGKFAQWLHPDYLIMATATPKDQRLLEFLASADKSEFESFTVSRDEVVAARLNKRYIEAIVYDLRQSVQSVVDLKRTVLRQAWKRNQKLKRQLAEAGINLTPLMLVQVANGEKTVEEAEQDLVHLCGVPPPAIGKHSADEPDPVLMAAIANNPGKEVLIFKQSAGTGFDAPRAFVLASTKTVNDPDFAMQFIGRVMRVSKAIRARYAKTENIPADLDTAFVYLANAEAQSGFEAAVLATSQIKSQLEGQTEKLVIRQTVSGAVVITNRATPQAPLTYDLPLPGREAPIASESGDPLATRIVHGQQPDMFAGSSENELDELQPSLPVHASGYGLAKTSAAVPPVNAQELILALAERGLRAYQRTTSARNLPHALKREQRPEMADMSKISRNVAAKLDIPNKLAADAIKVALNKLKETETHTELTTHAIHDEVVQIVTDRNALAREALQSLRSLPQVEDEDCRIIIEVLSQRMLPLVREAFDDFADDQVADEKLLQRSARDAAHWVALRQTDFLAEAMHEAIADQSETIDAGPLPDAMLFPTDLPLKASRKNIFGVLPPSSDERASVEQVLMLDDRALMAGRQWSMCDQSGKTGGYFTDAYDGSATLNGEELAFAKALDRSDFVAWWHRNPDRKPYSVRLVRGEHRNFFHPDFVVCLEHFPGDQPIIRLIETKENVKDAARKAKHVPAWYGKVLFLTKDQSRLRWVKEDGSFGSEVELDDLSEVAEWLRASRPMQPVA
ncbi:DEAD/DEAH box helicase [Propionivibrio sp.]|uniref:DEAD/DEAH box helicase n=1 Tax=Propionivibrio sp. TaxID=2212460 RepID=UPI003BF06C8E